MVDNFTEFLEKRKIAARAFCKGDPSKILALSAEGDAATLFDHAGCVAIGAQEVHAASRQGAAKYGPNGYTRFQVLDKQVCGELAFWTALQHAELEIDGTLQPVTIRMTEVFRFLDGSWKMVHRHASVPQAC